MLYVSIMPNQCCTLVFSVWWDSTESLFQKTRKGILSYDQGKKKISLKINWYISKEKTSIRGYIKEQEYRMDINRSLQHIRVCQADWTGIYMRTACFRNKVENLNILVHCLLLNGSIQKHRHIFTSQIVLWIFS